MRNIHILIVDDDEGMTETLKDILEHVGYHVGIAEDGCTALEEMEHDSYDVAFVDFRMPGIDGLEAIRRIRKADSSIRLFMITAFPVENLEQNVVKEGAQGVLYKPLDIKNILDIVKNLEDVESGRS
ncbi:MAG: response regulator [Theionarchaea archaeon]|nr:response regulator [Theionarchaea archaeon]